ncbi:TM0106 family RecB-like putative nuclease [Oscillatoria sp. CS-180]|uniref:TM0106 family RecB-like putative nuclease n=1 Tax=Oscillatoria sp. CS-180 TaxID=3021720 RepID=UPI00232AD0FE|nr:TM0106 family RecB-like putative nuclease [Oscillatoria sp. CS-180]MDB9528429.1 TM0106 family RecB-like putative nuclease [Oscillatoria sp. CS-180]
MSGGSQLRPLTEPHRPIARDFKDAAQQSLQWITDDLLLHYQRCSRRAYLDTHHDSAQADRPSDYLQKIKQDSAEHRAAVLEDYEPLCRPQYQRGDWRKGAQETIALMSQGVDYIVGGVLLNAVENDLYLVSRPDLLVKQAGWSVWGDWQYAPVDIKLGKKPKLDYQIVATFHAYVLAYSQGNWPHESWLALREGRYHSVDLDQQLSKFGEALEACLADLQSDRAPEVFIAHSRCDLCRWFSHCYETARDTFHLSLLPGVTPARYSHLKTQNLTTVSDLAQAHPTQLAYLPGFGDAVAEKLVHQAQATLYNEAIARTPTPPLNGFVLAPQDLPSAEVELYFDIEAAPDVDVIYLHGVLVVDHRTQTEEFHPLLAETVEDEQTAWEQFLDLVLRYPQAPIYHFCPYEAQTAKKLTQHYGSLPPDDLRRLLARFVDIHWCVTEAVTLPVESYALKHIARWMGFEWRDSDANGAQSICWYNEWLTTGDRAYLNAILRYNEDDCRATYHVKQWLTNFAKPYWQVTTVPHLTASA